MLVHRRKFFGLLAAGGAARALGVATATPPTGRAGHADPWLEINTSHLAWNLRQIQTRVGGKPVMAVVKANAYGHGLDRKSTRLNSSHIQKSRMPSSA